MSTLRKTLVRSLKPVIERFPLLATTLRQRRDNQLNMAPTRTPQGFLLQGNPLMQQGSFEKLETAIVSTLLGRADVMVNVGANIGYYCCLALQAGKPVIAFEPMPSNLHHLMMNLQHNGWQSRAEVFPLALSDRSGVIEIYGGGVIASLVPGWANVDKRYKTLVPVNTADAVLGQRLQGQRCLVLVDVEGAEDSLLAGAQHLLGQQPAPVWLVEVTITEHLPRGQRVNPTLLQTFDRFLNRGYLAWAVLDPVRAVSRDEIVAIAAGGRDTLGTHNFLFARDAVALSGVLPA